MKKIWKKNVSVCVCVCVCVCVYTWVYVYNWVNLQYDINYTSIKK